MANKKRKDGRIKAAVYLGNNKYKYVYATTQKELDNKLLEVRLKNKKGLDLAAERDTFGEWADLWLELKQSSKMSTNRKAICGYRRADLSELDRIPISKIRTIDIQSIVTRKAKEGLSECVQNEIKNTAKQIFEAAVENRVIDFNPALYVKTLEPDPDKSTNIERRALTAEEQTWIETPTTHRGQLAAMIMMHAGLRRGELVPLLWTDIDLDRKTISVNKAVEYVNGRPVVKPTTKTESGIRTVYIPQKLVDYLKDKKSESADFLVCPMSNGKMMTSSGWRRMWDSYMSELNFKFGDFSSVVNFKKPKSRFAPVKIPQVISPITAHWLRHTFITNMYFAGVDILTAMQQAGHADAETTMQIYTHLDKLHKSKQMTKLDDYFSERDKAAGEG